MTEGFGSNGDRVISAFLHSVGSLVSGDLHGDARRPILGRGV